ncbi:MAG: hypothetical protein AAAB35_20000 [Phyllobacterium sp.]|uniref:hypothetical protein n=1 Tax=Phyllobacterium sp. TaxID=1871046 RepID=UPI0030F03E8A
MVEKRGRSFETKAAHPCCRQFNSQRHSIELSTDARDHRCLCVTKIEGRAGGIGPFHEQLDRSERFGAPRGKLRIIRWTGKGHQFVNMLSFHSQSFATGCQNVDLRRSRVDAGGQFRCCVYDMFAGIKNEESSLACEISNQTGKSVIRINRYPDQRGCVDRHQVRIAKRAKIDEVDRIRESSGELVCQSYRNGGFADAAGAYYCDKTRCEQFSSNIIQLIVSSYHSVQSAWQVGMSEISGTFTLYHVLVA